MANCESGGDWAYAGPGYFDGGLQFDPKTWRAVGGRRFAEYAYQASRLQQIAIANDALDKFHLDKTKQWPNCYQHLDD